MSFVKLNLVLKTDRPMDRPTDQRTDQPKYRSDLPSLKNPKEGNIGLLKIAPQSTIFHTPLFLLLIFYTLLPGERWVTIHYNLS